MLILSRKEGESIKIGDNITVEIISIRGGTVKIGINAPANIDIFRKELYDSIKNENIIASNVNSDIISNLNDMFNKDKK
ncbi:MAG: carbon storage regulator CsrA [Deltaproteobacteria bacterium]|jgi:carbon storage regulator|nr:carbon storage regulator CsrA [Deltaproteobacteria bacterium]MCL5880534.1 carbon storage regulator CsrA [Deltaproteobacteria bacterium]MDA8304042.1 carbon storage regulator CsrA [Deltaproteobacteria bacterium]